MAATAIDTASVMDITTQPDIVFVEGRGSWLTDHRGKKYLDFIQGWAVNCLGHSPPAVVTALIRQAASLINCSPAFFNAPMIELANVLTAASGLDKVFFTSSGAEANEGAIKLARKWGQLHRGGAHRIVSFHGGFHGRTLATMSGSGKPRWDTMFAPQVAGFDKASLNDIVAVANLMTSETVAVMIEPIQGEAGVFPAADEFLRALRQLTRDHGVLMIVDEIQTGIGRTGTMFGFEHSAIEPDIMTLAKGLGGGAPLGALLARAEVSCFSHGDQGGTFCGNPLMTAVGVAVMREISKPGFLEHVTAMGAELRANLERLSARHGFGDVRGRGLLLALDLQADHGPAIVDAARDHGLLVNSPRSDALRFMPALNISREDVDTAVTILDRVCEQLRR